MRSSVVVILLVACQHNPPSRDPVVAATGTTHSATPSDAPAGVPDATIAAVPGDGPEPVIAPVDASGTAEQRALRCKVDPEAQRRCHAAKQIYGQSLALVQCGGAMIPPSEEARRAAMPCACYSRAEASAHGDDCRLVPSPPPRPS